MSEGMKYRPEIDGLRAVAVIAVLIFHVDPGWLKGGFLGVDVFFVISGFLMTSIIQGRIENGSFSLKEFWLRRIRRLYPALLAMVGVVALLGGVILTNPERADLFQQSMAAIFSFSNILLWRTTGGYWDSDSENIALLHTWSLSLEEQFYVVFPVLLLIFHRFARKHLSGVVFLLTAVSIALCVYVTPDSRSAAFYLLPTRLWELLFGAMLSLKSGCLLRFAAKQYMPGVIATCGLILIFLSFWFIEDTKGFPGIYPIAACIGTVAIIGFGESDSLVKRFLSLKPINYIGRISYSLYLWHWPIIVFSRYVSPTYNPTFIVAGSLGLASLSYHFIENPFRRGFSGSNYLLLAAPVLVAICLMPIVLFKTNPVLPKELGNIDSSESMTRGWEFDATDLIRTEKRGIVVGSTEKSPSIVLIGSSHARVLSGALAVFSEVNHIQSVIMATSGAGITIKADSEGRGASLLNAQRLAILERISPKITIVAGMWSSEYTAKGDFKKNLEQCLSSIAKCSETVIVLSQVPQCSLPRGYERSLRKYIVSLGRSSRPIKVDAANQAVEANALVASTIGGMNDKKIIYLNIYDDLITTDGDVEIMRDGKLTYSDFHHLNDFGASIVFDRSIGPMVQRQLEKAP